MSSRRNICSASSRMASGSSSECPNASARSRWTCALAAPSRSASPPKSPPASAARGTVRGGVQVAHAGRGQGPAVRGGPQVPGQDAQHGGGAVHPGLDPAERLGDVLRAQLGQRRGHLQVGVRPRVDPAERLEDGGLAEDQAGVALLAGEHQAVQARSRSRPRASGRTAAGRRCGRRRSRRAAPGSGPSRAARRRSASPRGCRSGRAAAGPGAGRGSRCTADSDPRSRRERP